jgi:tetratricopeptide (TPR) repeat protein
LLADVACWQAGQASGGVQARVGAAERAVRWWPVEPGYRLVLAGQLGAAGRWPEVQAAIDAAVQLAPNDARVWAAGGAIYAWGGQADPACYRWAEAAYRQALAMAPNVAAWHTALGVVLAGQGRLPEAIAALERAVDLDATDGVAYLHLANLYQIAGRPGDAYRAWVQAERWGWAGGG